jgi:hypothetical protein
VPPSQPQPPSEPASQTNKFAIPAPFAEGDRVLVDGERPGTVRSGRDGQVGVYMDSSHTTHNYDPARVTLATTTTPSAPMIDDLYHAGDKVITRAGHLGTVTVDQTDRIVMVSVGGRAAQEHFEESLKPADAPSAPAPSADLDPESPPSFRVGDRVISLSSQRVGTVMKDAPAGAFTVRVQYDGSPQVNGHDPRSIELLTDERQTTIDDVMPTGELPPSSRVMESAIDQLYNAILTSYLITEKERDTAIDQLGELRKTLRSAIMAGA